MKRAKIVCTVGPASSGKRVLASMIRNGMDVARLNFSHGNHEQHRDYVGQLRELSAALGKPLAILQDLQGIKIRLGPVDKGAIRLTRGKEVLLRQGSQLSTASLLYVGYSRLNRELMPGHRVLIDDGLLQLRVKSKGPEGVRALVIQGGIVTDRKGVNLPDTKIRTPALTSKDKKDLDFGMAAGVDYVAVSFVRDAKDVKKVKRYIAGHGASTPVIAKIERPEALNHLQSILDTADGIMVARGDLGVEMEPEQVPILQKKMIRMANQTGKIVITATQMLESMTEHARPTRAEAADVANAVIDGSDALMLSAETSVGKNPVQSVQMMRRIIAHTEKNATILAAAETSPVSAAEIPYAVADAAVHAAQDTHAKAIVAFTQSGYTARVVSKFRPRVPILAFTTTEMVKRRLSLAWGVVPLIMDPLDHPDRMISEVEKSLKGLRLVKRGDTVVILASMPLSTEGRTNFMKLHTVG